MSTLAQRSTLLGLIDEACSTGARLHKACALIGLAARTVQRWVDAGKNALYVGDRRAPDQRVHNCPPNKLSDAERQVALGVLNSEEFKDLAPSQIVPRLADRGLYVASESTLYRLLGQAGQLARRRVERAPQKRSKPRALAAARRALCVAAFNTPVRESVCWPPCGVSNVAEVPQVRGCATQCQRDKRVSSSWPPQNSTITHLQSGAVSIGAAQGPFTGVCAP